MSFKKIFAPAALGDEAPSACQHSGKLLFGVLALTFAPMLLAHAYCLSQEPEAARSAPSVVAQVAAAR